MLEKLRALSRAEKRRLWLLAAAFLGSTAMAAACAPYFLALLRDPAAADAFIERIRSYGSWSVAALMAVQVFQIVLAFLPGEPVEFAAGVLFGGWGGLAVCEAGILLGTALVFFGVRRFGAPLARIFVGEREHRRYRFLQNPARRKALLFLLFLIPGTPKDALTYLAGLSAVEPKRFLIIATLARLPSVITSTFAGAALDRGRPGWTLAIYAFSALFGLCGIWLNEKLMQKLERENTPRFSEEKLGKRL